MELVVKNFSPSDSRPVLPLTRYLPDDLSFLNNLISGDVLNYCVFFRCNSRSSLRNISNFKGKAGCIFCHLLANQKISLPVPIRCVGRYITVSFHTCLLRVCECSWLKCSKLPCVNHIGPKEFPISANVIFFSFFVSLCRRTRGSSKDEAKYYADCHIFPRRMSLTTKVFFFHHFFWHTLLHCCSWNIAKISRENNNNTAGRFESLFSQLVTIEIMEATAPIVPSACHVLHACAAHAAV